MADATRNPIGRINDEEDEQDEQSSARSPNAPEIGVARHRAVVRGVGHGTPGDRRSPVTVAT